MLEALRQEEALKPGVLRQCWPSPGATVTYAEQSSTKPSHGRLERRECWALSDRFWNAEAGIGGTVGQPWPGLEQLVAIRRWRTVHGKTSLEVAYLITSLDAQEATADVILPLNRSYWGIEDRLHYVRDETLGEDRSQVRSGSAPTVMAGLRNLLLGLLRPDEAGLRTPPNIAARLRTFAGRPIEAIRLVLSARSRSPLHSRSP